MVYGKDNQSLSYLIDKLGYLKVDEKDQYEEKWKVENVCFASKWTWTILTLSKEVEFNDYIQPACIPRNMKESALDKAKCYLLD